LDAHPGNEAPVPPHPKDAHFSTVNSLSCSRNQFEMLEEAIRGWVHDGHKGMDRVRNNAQVGRGI